MGGSQLESVIGDCSNSAKSACQTSGRLTHHSRQSTTVVPSKQSSKLMKLAVNFAKSCILLIALSKLCGKIAMINI